MSDFGSKECLDSELDSEEARLRAHGYQLTAKRTEKDLLPMEYMKSSFHGTAQSFEGQKRWLIRWRIR